MTAWYSMDVAYDVRVELHLMPPIEGFNEDRWEWEAIEPKTRYMWNASFNYRDPDEAKRRAEYQVKRWGYELKPWVIQETEYDHANYPDKAKEPRQYTAWDLLGDLSEHEGGFRVRNGRVKWERAHYNDGHKLVCIYRIVPGNDGVRLMRRYVPHDTPIELLHE